MRTKPALVFLHLSCVLPLLDPGRNDYPDLPSSLPTLLIDDGKTPVPYYDNRNVFVLKLSSFKALDIPIITRNTQHIPIPKKILPKGKKPQKIRVLRRY